MSNESESKVIDSNVEYWKNRWEENRTGWHVIGVNPKLIEYFDKVVLPDTSTFSNKKIFVPLCGKTKDLAYLLSRGLQVFAVEGVKQPIQELNQENNFNLVFNEAESLYHTQDNRLQIYLGDFYKCPIEKWGPFDFIWDRASFIAIDYDNRLAYKEIMQRSVQVSKSKYHSFRYLLEVVRYDKSIVPPPGPPRAVDEKDMQDFFGDWTNIEILGTGSIDSARLKQEVAGGNIPFDSVVYLLTAK